MWSAVIRVSNPRRRFVNSQLVSLWPVRPPNIFFLHLPLSFPVTFPWHTWKLSEAKSMTTINVALYLRSRVRATALIVCQSVTQALQYRRGRQGLGLVLLLSCNEDAEDGDTHNHHGHTGRSTKGCLPIIVIVLPWLVVVKYFTNHKCVY